MRVVAFAAIALSLSCAPKPASHRQAEAGAFPSPEALGKHAFESLRAGDEYAWERALATDAELGEIALSLGGEKTPVALRMKEERDHAAMAFREIRASVGEWSGVALGKIDAPVGVSNGIEGSDVAIAFTRGGERFLVRLDDCMKSKRGWVIGGTPRLERP